jgi:hypothetical protein
MTTEIQPSNPGGSSLCTVASIVDKPERYKDVKIRFLGWYSMLGNG